MTVRQAVGALLCVAGAASGRATAQVWLPAACDIKPGHVLVNQGTLYLKSATTTKFADERTKDLKDAERVLTQAVTSGGQEKNPAAWYYLGRYYLMANDLVAADSALTKALALAPACKDDIGLYRRQAWVPVFNGGVQAWQAGNTDSAIASFRRGNAIYQAEPMGFIYLGNLFVSREAPDSALRRTNPAKYRDDSIVYANRVDSAAKYFRLAVPAAADPKYAKDRRDAFFNVARVYHSMQRYDEARAAYREYLAAYPGDVQAMASLALIYTNRGRSDSATALYAAIVDHADSAEANDLFSAAQVVLSTIPDAPDTIKMGQQCRAAAKRKTPALTAGQLAAKCAPAAADTMRKFHAVADPQYRLVVKAYEAALAKDPYDRDGLYNLAGISYLLGDSAKVLPLAQRLYGVDPMNRNTLAKIAGGWQLIGKKDSVLRYLQIAEALPVDVTVSSFNVSDKGARLDAAARNFHAKASTPVTITFEFVNQKGDVVASQPHEVPALNGEATHQFQLKVDGTGIVAWRYKGP
ncbi:MAG TPA: tetratricopeptide repeat protein [Gemmatimonadales bacterium]|nr:tetratricopeptide repeat protein [Gemmatimonadales bacterium]